MKPHSSNFENSAPGATTNSSPEHSVINATERTERRLLHKAKFYLSHIINGSLSLSLSLGSLLYMCVKYKNILTYTYMKRKVEKPATVSFDEFV